MKVRQNIVFYCNGKRTEVSGADAFTMVARFLRESKAKTGTKIVCEEGDCGACSVLFADALNPRQFKAINSCIFPVYALDACQIVTVEGLQDQDQLHPVQQAMVENFGSQCGYCTPGMVCAMAAFAEDSLVQKKALTEKRARNFLTGNLCRCTGYTPILEAATRIDVSKLTLLADRYGGSGVETELKRLRLDSVLVSSLQQSIFIPATIAEAIASRQKKMESVVIAGATDLGVRQNKGAPRPAQLISLAHVDSLYEIKDLGDRFWIGARVTLSQLENFAETQNLEFAKMLRIFASPQIKNNGTLVGNIVNASPIADTIPFLLVTDTELELQNKNGKRQVALEDFYLGYKKLALEPSELVSAVILPKAALARSTRLYKVSTRKDLDISTVTLALSLELKQGVVSQIKIALGGVGPIVLRMKAWEQSWQGKSFSPHLFEDAISQIPSLIKPLSDLRGSKEYRIKLCQNLLKRAAREIVP